MEPFERPVNNRPRYSENIFAFYRQPAGNSTACIPYILRETMVNHKKMVHPPCLL